MEASLGSMQIFTAPVDFAGTPTMSVPCGFSPAGPPRSLLLVGRDLGEGALCCLAHACEQATDWHPRHPASEVLSQARTRAEGQQPALAANSGMLRRRLLANRRFSVQRRPKVPVKVSSSSSGSGDSMSQTRAILSSFGRS